MPVIPETALHLKIGIAGAGGIGSNVAFHLVRSGVTHLKIYDFDRVEAGNLERQFYFADQVGSIKVDALKSNLLRIHPQAKIEANALRLEAENVQNAFDDCDIVVEAFDRAETKAMLINALAESGKFIVSGSGLAGLAPEGIHRKTLGRHLVVAGDFASDMENLFLYSPKVQVVASLMALTILQKLGFPESR